MEKSRFTALWGILHKLVGVKDFVNMRISLPAELLDPVPNLEHWNYMERPDYFARISDPEDPVDRMLAVAAWWFTKDIKYIHHKLKKPYNSILGEQFLCHWLVEDPAKTAATADTNPGRSSEIPPGKLRVEYITEQISHHPPVSAYHYRCLERGIHASGLDHICARFTGTSVRVEPGERARGLYLQLDQRDNEAYTVTHPAGNVTGFLRGQLTVQIADQSVVTCPQTGLALIIIYKEERWFGKNKYAVEGKVFRYDPKVAKDSKHHPEKMKFTDIPKNQVVATLEGSWRGQIHVTRTSTESGAAASSQLLVDLEQLAIMPKRVKPLEQQHELESRRVWADVTDHLVAGRYSAATKAKHIIEDRQRHKAAEDKKLNREFQSEFFTFESCNPYNPILKEDRPFNI
ncbi:oxysterol-binding protein [Dimargaris cristalligena]|uniref:Oxysterol-binding protein n=1 Tax=Dimargaris cristalligena TaxID=215637 RepID=A0A4P9ZXI1_9FUNG|nr:oxysterol-binding protein [Dimargaris cristalligena]|eukprot:RKP38088.1 oxysterol-binding protein [Dimargaris cristalligena]